MKEIRLTQGRVALVDDADYDFLNQWKWCAQKDNRSHHIFYAVRSLQIAKYKRRTESMHRLILGLKPGDKRECDHRDGNGLNNQISNLRFCTNQQNHRSSRKRRRCTSRYKGVDWNSSRQKWRSQIQVNDRRIFLGRFDSEIEAAKAYDAMALRHYGIFALTNEMLGLFSAVGL